ncbi:MAG: selenocysteine-specific translation elongation factor [Acidimicrobiia bacterium]
MPIIGTAGHVDHGKSTLVQALTGRDPDRWDEEKSRGLTIDLGFAWSSIGGTDVGFVDVPGHERFIKNMLAGVGAVDAALFVVAADEGWMPQSEEHAAVLDLLGVEVGVFALTRIDTVDDDLAELAELEITEHATGTTLEGWPIVRVSAPKATGIEALRIALADAIHGSGPRPIGSRPRLWVDRAFSISGAGTVVTGTLVDGPVSRGEELTLWPPGNPVRVRGIQSHEREIEHIDPGSRAALNLAGTDRGAVARGAMLGRDSHFRTTEAFLVSLRTVRTLEAPITDRGAYHLHVGSGSWPVAIRIVDEPSHDSPGAALVRTNDRIPLVMGDRFILREVGRRAVVAGGRVLDPHPPNMRRTTLRPADLTAALDAGPDARADALLAGRGLAAIGDLSRDSGGGTPRTGFQAGDIAITETEVGRLVQEAVRLISGYQLANPLRPGAPKASVASALELPVSVLERLADTTDELVDDGSTIRTYDYAPAWGDAQEQAWRQARTALITAGLGVPRASQLGLDDEVFHLLLREGKLVRVADDLVYLPEQIDGIITALGGLKEGFTVADFRDALDLSRRQAVPLLEWLDAAGWTSRRGDVRTVRRRSSQTRDDAPPQ